MSYLECLSQNEAPEESKETLENIKKKLGRVPNIYAAMAHSPAALKGFLGFNAQLKSGVLSGKEIEIIALVAAEENQCHYCVAAHTAMAKMAGFSLEETKTIRQGELEDAKLNALAVLCREVVKNQGRPSQEAVKKFFDAGYGKAALVELIALVAVNIFTNYFNDIVEPEIDFPKVQ